MVKNSSRIRQATAKLSRDGLACAFLRRCDGEMKARGFVARAQAQHGNHGDSVRAERWGG
jgi:hypothetical protein